MKEVAKPLKGFCYLYFADHVKSFLSSVDFIVSQTCTEESFVWIIYNLNKVSVSTVNRWLEVKTQMFSVFRVLLI